MRAHQSGAVNCKRPQLERDSCAKKAQSPQSFDMSKGLVMQVESGLNKVMSQSFKDIRMGQGPFPSLPISEFHFLAKLIPRTALAPVLIDFLASLGRSSTQAHGS